MFFLCVNIIGIRCQTNKKPRQLIEFDGVGLCYTWQKIGECHLHIFIRLLGYFFENEARRPRKKCVLLGARYFISRRTKKNMIQPIPRNSH